MIKKSVQTLTREDEDDTGRRRKRMSGKRRVGSRVYKMGVEKGGGGRGEEGDMAKARIDKGTYDMI